jgi:TatA/E family protein of Tat protein translocase
MGPVGVQEMIVIFILALLLFGPKKLPELGRTIGKALTEFRRASNDLKATFEREMHSLEQESASLKEVTHKAATDIYDSSFDESAVYDHNTLGGSEALVPSVILPPVSASEVPGAESQGAIDAANHAAPAAPAVEGTVPRAEAGRTGEAVETPKPRIHPLLAQTAQPTQATQPTEAGQPAEHSAIS